MLEELQSLSEGKKKQILIIATIIIMVIITGVWFSYFNSVMTGMSQSSAEQSSSTDTTAPTPIAIAPAATTTVSTQASGPGLWQDIKNGFGWFGSLFSHPSQYKIQPK